MFCHWGMCHSQLYISCYRGRTVNHVLSNKDNSDDNKCPAQISQPFILQCLETVFHSVKMLSLCCIKYSLPELKVMLVYTALLAWFGHVLRPPTGSVYVYVASWAGKYLNAIILYTFSTVHSQSWHHLLLIYINKVTVLYMSSQ